MNGSHFLSAVIVAVLTGTFVSVFTNSANHNRPTIIIQSRIGEGRWVKKDAIYPLKGQKIELKVDKIPGAKIRWFQIVPDTSRIYKNANFPWEKDAYKWLGLAEIDYEKRPLPQFQGRWQIRPFAGGKSSRHSKKNKDTPSGFYHEDVGSFWFQAEVAKDGTIYRSPGIEDSDNRGLSPKVFRVSIRDGKGYIGYLSSFFNVPGLFGSVTYQSNNYIGVDCADVLVAAYGKWKKKPIKKNYNVSMLVTEWPKVTECNLTQGRPDKQLKWKSNIRAGDFIAVRYSGSRQYQHVGAIFSDANKNKILDADDLVIHAGPHPLRLSYLRDGNFDGHVVILRPQKINQSLP